VPSHLGNAVRTAIVLVLSASILFWSGEYQKTHTLTPRTWLFLALSGVATAVSWVAYFKALSLGSATPVSAIDKSSLVITMLLAFVFLGERLTWTNWFGVALVVVGSIVASLKAQ
jgi:transporter family protein